MKYSEVLAKVKANLILEENLKNQIKETENNQMQIQDKLVSAKERLTRNKEMFPSYMEDLIKKLQSYGWISVNNLSYKISKNENDEMVCNLQFEFMGKVMNLISNKYTLISNDGNVDTDFVIKEMFKKYLEVGDDLFNESTIGHLNKTEELYSKNPELVTSKFEKFKLEQIWNYLKDKRSVLQESYDIKLNKIDKLESKIEKSKVYKNKLINKLFNRREKFEKEQDILLTKTEDVTQSMKAIDMEFADKSVMEADVKEYVGREIKALFSALKFVEDFKNSKKQIQNYQTKNIDYVIKEIDNLDGLKHKEQEKQTNLKNMLKLTKKVNKETAFMAMKDKQFIDELNQVNVNKVDNDDKAAFDLLYDRYGKVLSGEIKKLI